MQTSDVIKWEHQALSNGELENSGSPWLDGFFAKNAPPGMEGEKVDLPMKQAEGPSASKFHHLNEMKRRWEDRQADKFGEGSSDEQTKCSQGDFWDMQNQN